MKKVLLLVMLASAVFVQASEEKKTESLNSIIEAYRSGEPKQISAASTALKEMHPDSYRAIEDLIGRTLSEEEKLKSYQHQLDSLQNDVAVQQAFVEALNKRLSQLSDQNSDGSGS